MFRYTITPRVIETDYLGHINNTVFPVWNEQARVQMFLCFSEHMNESNWSMLVARHEYDMKAEVQLRPDVECTVEVEKFGNSSLVLRQRIYQEDKLCVDAKTVYVNVDRDTGKPTRIPDEIREALAPYEMKGE